MTNTKKTRSGRSAAKSEPQPRKLPIIPIVGGVVAIALIVTILLTVSGGDPAPDETGDPIITGTALPIAVDNANDGAIGRPIPTVTGADFEGNPVSISPDDGRIKVIVFIAHWCPHCQAEVPLVQDFVAAGGVPPEIDFYSVATGISPTRENYPPSDWLVREEWNIPVIVDDAGSSIAGTYGLSAYPYWVFADDQGNVLGRITGRINPDNLAVLFDRLIADGTS